MISGCMIDGFGWFHEADYRRSWLLLKEVDYVLPRQTRGPLSLSDRLDQRVEFRVVRPEVSQGDLAGAARRDAADEVFLKLAASVPQKDAEYAQLLVWCDVDARELLQLTAPPAAPLALAYLVNKLVQIADSRNLAPLVGQAYASDLLCWKVARSESLPWKRAELKNRLGYAAFAAGLSLDFLEDEELACVPLEALAEFKRANAALLERSQAAVQDVARRFEGLPSSDAFQAELGKLRHDALEERMQIDELARKAWTDAGLRIGGRAVAAAASGLGGGLLLLSSHQAAVTAVAAVGAVVAGEALELIKGLAAGRRPRMSYLLKAGELARKSAGDA